MTLLFQLGILICMNKTTIHRENIESLGFTVDTSHSSEWDTHKVTVHFHGNKWAEVERHNLEQAMLEAHIIINSGVYGENIIN